MLHLGNESNYLSEYVVEGEEKVLTHVWFAHPEGLEILKAWPDVILMDSTYKTNKYDLILVQCVGVTPVGKSFLIGYALIKRENSDGYIWVLRRLKSLLGPDVKPTVFVTDHERGLLSALPVVFRMSYHFLCLFHIYNAVEAKATIMEKNGNFGKAVAHGAWRKVIEAKTFDECKLEWNELKKKYRSHPALIDYLESTWWHKIHMFGKCFTNLVLHFGNTTTSRVESAHAQLKMWLGSAELTLDSLWKRADVMMHGQHIEIRKTLEDSINKRVVSNLYYGNIFSMLGGRVWGTAIEAMQVEYNRGTDLGCYLEEYCGCTIWTTHKLLCACKLHAAVAEGRKIHPSDIHGFWSRLAYTESSHRRSSPNDVMEELFNKVRKYHVSVQRDVFETLFSKLYPEDEVVEEPEKAETCRGRPRKSNTRNKSGVEHAKRSHPSTTTTTGGGDGAPLTLNFDLISHIGGFIYEEFVPIPVKDCLLGAFDPDGDGHCGFRVFSHAKTGNAKNYIEMRNLLLGELQHSVYHKVYYGNRNDACRRIRWANHRGCVTPANFPF
ncbi:PKS-NRPS hybrid synthetase cheA-like [Silene latifolia]|uniref:PKS-NRPS hybrid synthetase cheA-like n=1 Tax=Silene latifolia TaxID=37657 RepID=UPI003D77D004